MYRSGVSFGLESDSGSSSDSDSSELVGGHGLPYSVSDTPITSLGGADSLADLLVRRRSQLAGWNELDRLRRRDQLRMRPRPGDCTILFSDRTKAAAICQDTQEEVYYCSGTAQI